MTDGTTWPHVPPTLVDAANWSAASFALSTGQIFEFMTALVRSSYIAMPETIP